MTLDTGQPTGDRAGPGSPDGSRPPAGPRPLGGLADLAELLDGESPGSRRFIRGLVIGALVGAALAGVSALRRRNGDASDRGRGTQSR
jgi:hypothetical protein